MKNIKALSLLCCLVASLALTACGDASNPEQSSVKKTTQQYVQSLNAGDAKQLSSILAIHGQNAQAVKALAVWIAKNFKNTFDAARLQALQQAIDNGTVSINGNNATLDLKDGPAGMGPYHLVKLNGSWKLELPRDIQGIFSIKS
jgi:hypothetical protein